MSHIVFRLQPNMDLRSALQAECRRVGISSGAIVTCVGSLKRATLRLAGADIIETREGPFEICSLVGTLTPDGVHFHISLADAHGQMWGGHLCEGSPIHTTAEIVILDLSDQLLRRTFDPNTGYPELHVPQKG
jgi:predicted DNA-binding protein with PD1-like motif